ncbi:MAG: 8-hydroxy-5-deazaflavin:NADPH oxidoreductase [Mycobacterium sp.]|jgi:predicted dinucleotide-binding enzyme|nr:8-hydroxy-5-deazaflavin:NADPH oxidoreductase [Mycobacterium sp.]
MTIESIGIIGSGEVARALAKHAVGAGYQVLISNSRGPESLAGVVDQIGGGAQAVTVREAARADLVVVAIPFVKVPELTDAADWSGTVVVDATNQFAQYRPTYAGFVDLGDETGSEWVARRLPGAAVLKAFNAMFASYLAPEPKHAEGRQIVFYAGDDEAVGAQFATFVERLGFAPVSVGGLRDGGRLLQLGGSLSGVHALRQD